MKNLDLGIFNTILLFSITNLFAMVLAIMSRTITVIQPAFQGQQNNPLIAVYFIGNIIVVTLIVLYLARKNLMKLVKGIFYLAMSLTIFLVLTSLFYFIIVFFSINIPFPELLSLAIAVILTVSLLKKPEWYLMDLFGVVAGAGVALILGISIGIVPAVILLIVLAVYDAISVYRTKHMVSLAENVISQKLPALFVVPRKEDYTYSTQKTLQTEGEKEAYFMGFGDAIIPAVLIVSSITYLNNYMVGIATFFGALVGLIMLMILTTRGNPQAGLPFINSGALIFFLIFYILI